MTESIALLGSTGSIGTQVLDVVARFPERFSVHSLAAGKNIARLAEQILQFNPKRVCIADLEDVETMRGLVPGYRGEVVFGPEGLNQLAEEEGPRTLVVGLVGMMGLEPTLKALESGKKVLTANKETFVAGGHLVQPWLDRVIPIDSEHSAIHQCLRGQAPGALDKIYLTASGGPFRRHTPEQLRRVTLEDALKHPNWVMGRKITIDSATMMNKGLEVIEARWLFGLEPERIRILVHPQSIVHSGVELIDGSLLFQLGAPDMRGPIQYALAYPERLPCDEPACRLDMATLSRLDFEQPDEERFPSLRLAYEAARMGSGACAVLNAADEAAVALFLEERISFLDIARLIERTLEVYETQGVNPTPTLAEIQALDAWARTEVYQRAVAPQPRLVLGQPAF